MAGFLLTVRNEQAAEPKNIGREHESVKSFEKRYMSLDRVVSRPMFDLYLFRKATVSETFFLEISCGYFVCCTGTMFYKGASGKDALRRVYWDHVSGSDLDRELRGNFALILYSEKGLFLITDFNGYYPVYYDARSQVYATSFLAVAKADKARNVRTHEFYEYILQGFFTGPATYLENVDILQSRAIWRLLPEVETFARHPSYRPVPAGCGFGDLVEDIAAQYRRYVETLGELWGGPIGTALSGGYDTRFMLAMLRRAGIPAYVYVYGSGEDANVKVARRIADMEGIDVETIDKNQRPRIALGDFPGQVDENLYFFDGIHPMGFIDDGTDMQTRLDRANKAELQLNGAGGEIYREIWNVGDRSIDLEKFLRMRYDIGTYDFVTEEFDAARYFGVYVEKTKSILGIQRDWISRNEVEKLFPYLRNMFAAPTNGVNNHISYSLIPFMEPCFTLPSYDIPIRYKYAGRLEAALIDYFDRDLARHPNEYGFGFSGDAPFSHRMKRRMERHIPLTVRLAKRRVRAGKSHGSFPYYLGADYLRQIVERDEMKVSKFLQVTRIGDPEILNRALSAELVFQAVGASVNRTARSGEWRQAVAGPLAWSA